MNIDVPATLTAVGAIVTAIGVIVIAVLNYRSRNAAYAAKEAAGEAAAASQANQAVIAATAAENKAAIVQVGDDLFLLGKRVDGRLSELLDKSEIANLAQGRTEGIAAEKARQQDEDAKIGKALKQVNGGTHGTPEP